MGNIDNPVSKAMAEALKTPQDVPGNLKDIGKLIVEFAKDVVTGNGKVAQKAANACAKAQKELKRMGVGVEMNPLTCYREVKKFGKTTFVEDLKRMLKPRKLQGEHMKRGEHIKMKYIEMPKFKNINTYIKASQAKLPKVGTYITIQPELPNPSKKASK